MKDIAKTSSGQAKALREELSHIDRQSDELHRLMTKQPIWIVKWGITILFLITVLFLSFSPVLKHRKTIPVNFKADH